MSLIRENFERECQRILGSRKGGPEILALIFSEYQKPERHYHNLFHLSEMSQIFGEFQVRLENAEAVFLACLFHDFVYDSRSGENEKRSAAEAELHLSTLGFGPQTTAVVRDLILSTEKHKPVLETFDNRLFLDADLAILGAPRGRYQDFMNAIRREYGWVPEKDYRDGRGKVLKNFLERPEIYFTDPMRERLEKAARENLSYELEVLAGISSPNA